MVPQERNFAANRCYTAVDESACRPGCPHRSKRQRQCSGRYLGYACAKHCLFRRQSFGRILYPRRYAAAGVTFSSSSGGTAQGGRVSLSGAGRLDTPILRLRVGSGTRPPTSSRRLDRKNVGRAAIGYLQQLPPSQQAGDPQHIWTVAARAPNESKRVAANANTSALSFITISFEDVV